MPVENIYSGLPFASLHTFLTTCSNELPEKWSGEILGTSQATSSPNPKFNAGPTKGRSSLFNLQRPQVYETAAYCGFEKPLYRSPGHQGYEIKPFGETRSSLRGHLESSCQEALLIAECNKEDILVSSEWRNAKRLIKQC